jgi:hypothetical protein
MKFRYFTLTKTSAMKRKYVREGDNYAKVMELNGPVRKMMTVTRKVYVREGKLVIDSVLTDKMDDTINFMVMLNDTGIRIWDKVFKDGETVVAQYNETGKCTKTFNFKKKALTQICELEYDAADRILNTSIIDPTGQVTFRNEYVYRSDGQMAETRSYQKSNSSPSRVVFIYDEQGRRNRIEAFTADGVLERIHEYVFDDKGRTLEESTIYLTESMKSYGSRIVNVHNDKGDIVAQTFYDHAGKVKNEYSYTYEYDQEGKKIRPEEPEDPDSRVDVLLTDEQGNWTQQVVYHHNRPLYMQERTFVYADMPDRALEHPLDREDPEEGIKLKDTIQELSPMSPKLLRWVMDVPGMTADQFPVLRYYTARFDEPAVPVNFYGNRIENRALYELLKEQLHGIELHSYHNARNGDEVDMVRYTLEFPYYKGYMVQAYNIVQQDPDNFVIPEHMSFLHHEYANLGPILLLKPRESSSMYDRYMEERIRELIDQCTLTKLPSKPRINVIEVRGQNYAVVEHKVSDSFTIRDLDINYGQGFTDFHNELMNRFKAQSKGLVLFHGVPGTGKTYYIRHLLRQMAQSRKRVLYMPPNMVDHLTDPSFMTFLINTVKSWSHDGDFCVLLIEDAEPLLAKRQEGVRIQGVTNLLNMTDGLLNDMLNLQIICTFNVDLRRLDSALLRPGRLLARKEFRPLGVLDANLLAQRLGIKHHFDGPTSLSEIYAHLKDSNTLVHDVDPDRDRSSQIDDLM